MKITQTNGNSKNGIRGSRITIWANGTIVDRFTIPTKNAMHYLNGHKKGKYADRYRAAIAAAQEQENA